MTHYDKGSFFERQLKALFEAKGFFVVRAAGSGVAGDAPDLIVLRSGQKNKFGVECKAWKNAILLGQAHGNRLPGVGENHGNASVFGVESAAQGMAVLSIARA
ncbi:restriction endonuclease [Candidatus Micrarchaeota archaeon]|nr:restriction endonuclease [Candidatus Micrarchaeota archaeon]